MSQKKYFYYLVMDDEDPANWPPFQRMTMQTLKEKWITRPCVVDLPPPSRELLINMALMPRSKMFEESLDRIVGIILDGDAVRRQGKKRSGIVAQFGLILAKIKAKSIIAKDYGVSIIVCYTGPLNDEYHDVYDMIDAEKNSVLSERAHLYFVSSEEMLDTHLWSEMARLKTWEPRVMVEG